MSSMIELPKWLRIFNISAGTVTILLAILSLIFINRDIQTLITILAIALIVIGIFRTLNGIFQDYIEWYTRVLKISIGILVLPIAIAIWALSSVAPDRITTLLAFVLILNSISRINVSSRFDEYPNWYKVLTILIGVLSIVAAGIVLFFLPAISGPALVAIIATTFIFSGTGWIYAGIKQIEEV